MQFQSCMGVLRNRLCFEATDGLNGRPAQNGTGATEKGGIPEIISRLDDVIEKRLLGCYFSGEMQIAFVRVGIEEMLRRLDQRNVGVLKKADCLLEKTAHRYVVSIEDRQQLSLCLSQGRIQVSCFGVVV